jgi:DNA-binding MarR family transcriptional regulator
MQKVQENTAFIKSVKNISKRKTLSELPKKRLNTKFNKEIKSVQTKLKLQDLQWAVNANHVISRAEVLIEAYANKQFKKYSITQMGMAILYSLVEHNGKIPQKQLATILDHTKQATASAIKTLAKRQLIRREVGTQDHRLKIVRITEKGLKLAREGLSLRAQYYRCFTSCLSQDKCKQLTSILNILCDNLVKDMKKI